MKQLETLISKVAYYAETLTSVAAIAVSAIDTSQLPPKWAAGVVTAMGIVRVVREYVGNVTKQLPPAEQPTPPVAPPIQ